MHAALKSFLSILTLLLTGAGWGIAAPVEIPPAVATAPAPIPGLAPGQQELDGITWRIPGSGQAVQSISLQAGAAAPPIPLNAAPGELHFLHTGIPGPGIAEIEESRKIPAHPAQVFGYRLDYEDGRSITLHMDWRHHIAPVQTDWEPGPLYGARAVQLESGAYVYHVNYPNPRPGQVIRTITVVPPEKGADMAEIFVLGLSTMETETWAMGDRAWAVADYCALHGPASLALASGDGFGVPFHGKSDRGALVYSPQPVTGDFTAQARLMGIPLSATWGAIGLSARDSILYSGRGGAEIAPTIFFKPGPEQAGEKVGIFFQTAGHPVKGEAVMADGKPPVKLESADFDLQMPLWLRLERVGNTFIGSQSADGQTWTEVGRLEIPDCPETLYPTIYACLSHGPEMLHAPFEELTVRQ